MARRRTIGEILGQIQASELEISLKTQESGLFRGLKGPYLKTRMSHFFQTFSFLFGSGQKTKQLQRNLACGAWEFWRVVPAAGHAETEQEGGNQGGARAEWRDWWS